MQTVNNMLILESGELAKPEFRAAAKSSLQAGNGVALPALGLSFVLLPQGMRVVDVNKGVDHLIEGKSVDEVLSAITSYGTPERILAFLSV